MTSSTHKIDETQKQYLCVLVNVIVIKEECQSIQSTYKRRVSREDNPAPSRWRKSELLFLLPTPLESLDSDMGLFMSEPNRKLPVVGEGLRSRGDVMLLGQRRVPVGGVSERLFASHQGEATHYCTLAAHTGLVHNQCTDECTTSAQTSSHLVHRGAPYQCTDERTTSAQVSAQLVHRLVHNQCTDERTTSAKMSTQLVHRSVHNQCTGQCTDQRTTSALVSAQLMHSDKQGLQLQNIDSIKALFFNMLL